MPKAKRLLTEAEGKILAALWERPGLTMMEITRLLERETAWSKHTVTTLLKRMLDKGTVAMDDTGRTRRYHPAVTREAVVRQETLALLERFFGGEAAELLRWLAAEGRLKREDLEAVLMDTKDK